MYTWLESYCMSQPGAEKVIKKEWGAATFVLYDKLFALLGTDAEGKPIITLKLDPVWADLLRKEYTGITPGYYMNKTHWNSVQLEGSIPDSLIREMIDHSHGLIFKGLTKKNQQAIQASMVQSRCGLLCSSCAYRESVNCQGCTQITKPFWGETCPIKHCCESRSLVHCGLCEDFPCAQIHAFAWDPEQGDQGRRLSQCKRWKTYSQ